MHADLLTIFEHFVCIVVRKTEQEFSITSFEKFGASSEVKYVV